MPKPFESHRESKKQTNDLFAALGAQRAAPRSKPLRAPASAEAGYTARISRCSKGLETGTPPTRHVYRRHRREGAASSVRRGHRQCHGMRQLAGHASFIEVELSADGFLTVTDNGRGISGRSASRNFRRNPRLKSSCARPAFRGRKIRFPRSYETSGGLHGVGVSVVNALSSRLEVEVARSPKALSHGVRAAGHPKGKLEDLGKINNPPRYAYQSFKPDNGHLRRQGPPSSRQRPVQDGGAPRPICSAASRSAGAATPGPAEGH